MDLLQQQSRLEQQRKREGMKIGGLICIGVGAATCLLFWSQHDQGFLIGLTPAFVGAALLIYVYLLAAPLE
jgi:uncharacterized membrane protein YeaQ/YmgE (transglycosylase-associated protein family)